MNLLQTIIDYYHGEARHGLWAAVIGGLLLIGSLVLWKWASPLSLIRGFAVPALFFGLLMGIGGAADNIYTNKTAPGKTALYQKNSTAFLKQEKVKTEKTHQGWHGIRRFWAILGLSGVLLSLLMRKPFWIGAGLSTVVLALFLSLFEFYSMRFNERYYHIIQTAPEQSVDIIVQESNTQPPTTMQQTAVEPQVSGQKHAKPELNIQYLSITTHDSLEALHAINVSAITISDPLTAGIPNGLQNPALANETAQIYPRDKKRKVLDYYNSDLMQANSINAKHCWFSKKYIKE